MATSLSRLTGSAVVLRDRFGHETTRITVAGRYQPVLERISLEEVIGGGPELGTIELEVPPDKDRDDASFALRYAGVALGLQRAKAAAMNELENRLSRDLLDDLLGGLPADVAVDRASAQGHDLGVPHDLIVCAWSSERGHRGNDRDVDHLRMAMARQRLPCLIVRNRGLRSSRRNVRRYEWANPGDLVHVDIKKLGRIPDGGGWRVHGRTLGKKNRRGIKHGYWYIHNAVDDCTRLAYSELLADERKETAAGFWARANTYFESVGITMQRVLTDNGACYRSKLFAESLGEVTHKRTRPYRPQTNGKVERFNRTTLEEWAYARPYTSESERASLFIDWLHTYNHHRGHTALGGKSPADLVPNLRGQNN